MSEMAADLVRGWALGAPIKPVAQLRTRRRQTTLSEGDGRPLAVLDDDEVSILRGARVTDRFHELEVELADQAPDDLLPRLKERLEAAGAQPLDQAPKLVRALGPAALEPWELAPLELGARPIAAEVVRSGRSARSRCAIRRPSSRGRARRGPRRGPPGARRDPSAALGPAHIRQASRRGRGAAAARRARVAGAPSRCVARPRRAAREPPRRHRPAAPRRPPGS